MYMFYAKNFIRRLSKSIFSHFGTIHSSNVHRSWELQKKPTKTHYFRSSRSFKIIDVDSIKKLVISACYDKQYICAYLQLFLR